MLFKLFVNFKGWNASTLLIVSITADSFHQELFSNKNSIGHDWKFFGNFLSLRFEVSYELNVHICSYHFSMRRIRFQLFHQTSNLPLKSQTTTSLFKKIIIERTAQRLFMVQPFGQHHNHCKLFLTSDFEQFMQELPLSKLHLLDPINRRQLLGCFDLYQRFTNWDAIFY